MKNLSFQKNRIRLAEKEICDHQLRNAEERIVLFCLLMIIAISYSVLTNAFKLSAHQICFAFGWLI